MATTYKPTLPELFSNHIAWSRETFRHQSESSCLLHLKEEVEEILESTSHENKVEEYVDVLLLLLSSMSCAGISIEGLYEGIVQKIAKNKTREWIEVAPGQMRHKK